LPIIIHLVQIEGINRPAGKELFSMAERNGSDTTPPRNKSRRNNGRRKPQNLEPTPPPVIPGVTGGRFNPLGESDLARIHDTALDILEKVGMGEAPQFVADRLTENGCRLDHHERVLFPRSLIEDVIAGAQRNVVLHGQRPGHELELSPGRVYTGTGGAAPNILDDGTGRYRASTLRDLYDAARLVDTLDHIHFFSRSLVAGDMPTAFDLDINTAYACLTGTSKHVCVSATEGDTIRNIAAMCDVIAGGHDRFVAAPFLSLNINHVVSPLRYSDTSCAVMEQAAALGIPYHCNTFAQVGASNPASLAGAIAQTTAETLAGLAFGWLVNRDSKAVFGPRPMITDLRSGALSGGGGEQAVVMAGTVQMANHYGLPNSCMAGVSDSKVPDAQSGHEKALSVTLAAHAGCNMITQACGMQASLMGVALDGYVIDNDMLGSVLRSVRGIEVTDETLDLDNIRDAVLNHGHFLGSPDTFARMHADYLYPEIADRQPIETWEADGAPELRERAQAKVHDTLSTHFPNHLDPEIDLMLRRNHDIHLPISWMNPSQCSRNGSPEP